MKVSAGLAGGLAGTLAVASLHEAMKKMTPDAPRIDILNRELIRKGLKRMNKDVPGEDELQRWSVGGEIFCDTAYYSLAGMGGKRGVWFRGAVLGLIAGVTAVILPKPLGLPEEPSNKTMGTRLMTIGLYVVGGIVSAAVAQMVENAQSDDESSSGL